MEAQSQLWDDDLLILDDPDQYHKFMGELIYIAISLHNIVYVVLLLFNLCRNLVKCIVMTQYMFFIH